MKKILTLSFLISSAYSFSQNFQSLDTVKAYGDYENIYVRKVFSDSLASSFVIIIKKEVKPHKHVEHTEHVYVLEGKGDMTVGNKSLQIQKGDIIFIPKNIVHSLKVLSSSPVKVLSVQSPMFDGKDRVMVEEKK